MSVLEFESFAPRLNETFVLELGSSTMNLTLVRADKLPVHVVPGMIRSPFRLLFQSNWRMILPQQIYSFEHSKMGKVPIFIVPVGLNPDGVLYEALFN